MTTVCDVIERPCDRFFYFIFSFVDEVGLSSGNNLKGID